MTTAARQRLAAIPHKQASDIRWADVPAQPGVGAHRDPVVTTACGQEIATTLVTRTNSRVRCPDCRAAIAPGDPGSVDAWLAQLDRQIAGAADRTRARYTAARDELRERLGLPAAAPGTPPAAAGPG